MTDDAYDFYDWEIGPEAEEMLRKVVRENLMSLQSLIQDGRWVLREWNEDLDPLPPDECALEWKWGPNWIEDPALLSIKPAQVADLLIEGLQDMARDGMHAFPGDKDELREYWQRITAGWRAALVAIDAEAQRLLDMPHAPDA